MFYYLVILSVMLDTQNPVNTYNQIIIYIPIKMNHLHSHNPPLPPIDNKECVCRG